MNLLALESFRTMVHHLPTEPTVKGPLQLSPSKKMIAPQSENKEQQIEPGGSISSASVLGRRICYRVWYSKHGRDHYLKTAVNLPSKLPNQQQRLKHDRKTQCRLYITPNQGIVKDIFLLLSQTQCRLYITPNQGIVKDISHLYQQYQNSTRSNHHINEKGHRVTPEDLLGVSRPIELLRKQTSAINQQVWDKHHSKQFLATCDNQNSKTQRTSLGQASFKAISSYLSQPKEPRYKEQRFYRINRINQQQYPLNTRILHQM